MTISTQMNCAHQGEGWCLDCVVKLRDAAAYTIRSREAELVAKERYIKTLEQNNARLRAELVEEGGT